MKFELTRDSHTGALQFHGEVTERDMGAIWSRLSPFDKALLNSPTHASDYLLALEMLFRRHEEQGETNDQTI